MLVLQPCRSCHKCPHVCWSLSGALERSLGYAVSMGSLCMGLEHFLFIFTYLLACMCGSQNITHVAGSGCFLGPPELFGTWSSGFYGVAPWRRPLTRVAHMWTLMSSTGQRDPGLPYLGNLSWDHLMIQLPLISTGVGFRRAARISGPSYIKWGNM